ncbi:MAG: U32 family peptidase [Deltaproteobacteria bacterium]|nr:U32 family peptidase [Deltaproteobacteria bacterium]
MRLSVACNFDEALIDGLKGYPIQEVYGKVTQDYAGGGRPSFYLPPANKQTVERFVKKVHGMGIQFNYLMNASCMGNREYTREGQTEIRKTLDWVSEAGCDSVTVGQIYLLQMIKRCYPNLRVRISSHRFTDSVRKARFWEDHGADCIVLNETAFYREFEALRTIRESVKCDLQLIANNSCRTDCAIAGTHASSLSHASQHGKGQKKSYPLDYHMLFCLDYRLREPVNYVRANWIRPEDMHHYEAMGYDYFKIVERNTPTPVLLNRVQAYANRRYDGNFFDMVLPFQYPESSYTTQAQRDAYSLKRAVKYFFKPGQVNVAKMPKLMTLGKQMGLLYPMPDGQQPLYLDNRKMDGFIDRFLKESCIDVDCEKCRYCHDFADRALTIEPSYRRKVLATYRDIFEDMHTGKFWLMKPGDVVEAAQRLVEVAKTTLEEWRAKRSATTAKQGAAGGAGLRSAAPSSTTNAAPGGAAMSQTDDLSTLAESALARKLRAKATAESLPSCPMDE